MADMFEVTMEKIESLAKRRGFIFPGSQVYGGFANSWDFGPLGVLLKQNIKRAWWQKFVTSRLDMVGLESAIIMNPQVWEASGHVANFTDPLVECRKCHNRFRTDQIDLEAKCGACGVKGEFTESAQFNMLFKTYVGPKEEEAGIAYLRPETAQGMFVDFPEIIQTTRQRLPFGVAQIGKAFRNEITPGNYVFRTREFEQMEIEYFVKPDVWEKYFEEWLADMHEWIKECGIDLDRVVDHEIEADNLAHYSKRTVDLEFKFPFGQKELYGLAYREDFDLQLHAKNSGQDFSYTDAKTKESFVPHVIEPTFGVERTLLAMLISAYREEEVRGDMRVVLGLPARLAPYQVAVLPLSKKDELIEVSESLAKELAKNMSVNFDITQSIGKRYRRQDEIGTPWCVTVDFDSLNDKQVTVRERDSMKQERVPMEDVSDWLISKLNTKT